MNPAEDEDVAPQYFDAKLFVRALQCAQGRHSDADRAEWRRRNSTIAAVAQSIRINAYSGTIRSKSGSGCYSCGAPG